MMTYPHVTLYAMSGTGNTHRVAAWIAQAAAEQGAQARILPVTPAPPAAPTPAGPAHLLGLLFPTHGFTAPWAAIRFALRLPRGRGTHAFVSPTRAGTRLGSHYLPGLEGTGGYLLALILWLKGYALRGVLAIDMPSNWLALHPALSPDAVAGIIERARAKTDRWAACLLSGERYFGGRLPLLLGLLLLPASLGYLLMGRFFLAKLFFANEDCNGCGLCARHCPQGALRMWGQKRPRPYWTYACESCMRCMAFCPQQAVEAGHSWGVLLYFVTSVPLLDLLLRRLAGPLPWVAALGAGWAGRLLNYAYTLLAIALAYLLFHWLIRIPPVNRLFSWTTLTHYYRRYHEPGTRLSDLEHRY